MAEGAPAGNGAEAAAAARACFLRGDYAGARSRLQALGSASDPKLRHNLALADFYASGGLAPSKLLAALEGLKRGEGEGELVAEDNSLATYNAAVLHFQQQRFGRARALLEGLFGNVEPLDEFLAFRVCLLLLELTLLQRDVGLASQVLAYLDRSYAALTKADRPGGAAEQNGSGGAGAAADGADNGEGHEGGADGGTADGTAGAPPEWPNKRSSRPSPVVVSPGEVKLAMHLGRARLLLLVRSPQQAKREIKLALSVSGSNATALFLKVQLELLRGNAKQALKLIGALPLPPPAPPVGAAAAAASAAGTLNLRALYLNNLGCVHYGLGKYAVAALYFDRARRENVAVCGQTPTGADPFALDVRCECVYNLGVCRLLGGEPAAAFPLLLQALPKLWPWARLWLRLGECCVALCAAQAAAAEARAPSDERTRVGLVASSAALGGRRLLLPTARGGGSGGGGGGGGADAGGVGEAEAPAGAPAEAGSWPSAPPIAAGWGSEPPTPSLAFAAVCFRTALAAAARRSASAASLAAEGLGAELGGAAAADADLSPALKPSGGGGGPAAPAAGGGSGEEGGSGASGALAEQHATRLKLAWVCLELGDPLGALGALAELHASKAAAPAQRALALSYAAEALCALGRCSDAIALLSPAALADLFSRSLLDDETTAAAAGGGSGEPTDAVSLRAPLPCTPPSLLTSAMRCLLATNMAVAHVAHGDLQAAELCCGQALQLQPHAREPLLLLAHLQLRHGHSAAALALLRSGRLS